MGTSQPPPTPLSASLKLNRPRASPQKMLQQAALKPTAVRWLLVADLEPRHTSSLVPALPAIISQKTPGQSGTLPEFLFPNCKAGEIIELIPQGR